MKIYFRVDASREIGTGHVVRCVTLAKELDILGAECIFLSRDHTWNLFKYITENKFKLRVLNTDSESAKSTFTNDILMHSEWLGVSQKYDASQTISALGSDTPEWLVVDHYGIDYRWHELLRPHCKNILVIDDLADRKHDCDLLLDQNLVKDYLNRYENLVAPLVPKLLGPKFALLQEEYLEVKNRVLKRNNEVKNILVYFGGSDSHSLTESAVDTLMEILDNSVKVDVVSSNPGTSLIDMVNRNNNFKLHSNLPSLAPLMFKADLAIGAGGTTTWERCFMGLPSIVITTAENQIKSSVELDRLGYIKWVGHVGKIDLGELKKQIIHSIDSVANMQNYINFPDFLVDGQGVKRVCDVMLKSVKY